MLPSLSPNTCTSICRGRGMYCSITIWSFPNEAAASRLALAIASASASALATRRMPLPPPPRRGLEEAGVAGAIGGGLQRRDALTLAVVAGPDRPPRRLHQRLRRRFRAHQADGRGGRPDENQARIRAGLRETSVLGEKAVAGMERLGARRPRRVDDSVDVKV